MNFIKTFDNFSNEKADISESYYSFLGGNSNFTDDEMRKNVVDKVLGKDYDAYIDFDETAPKGEYDKMKEKYASDTKKWETIWRSASYQGEALLSPDKKIIKAKVFARGGIIGAIYVKKGALREAHEETLNEFGPLAGSGNARANDLDKAKRDAAKKSERRQMIYVVGGKHGTYKLSKYHEEGNTYAAYYNGMPQDLDESLVYTEDLQNYMFFSNLESIKRKCESILAMDFKAIDEMLNAGGHDWAADHITVAKENIDQVENFLVGQFEDPGQSAPAIDEPNI